MTCEETVAGIVSTAANIGSLNLRLARLGLRLMAQGSGLRINTPAGHIKFLVPQTDGPEPLTVPGQLILHVRNESLPVAKSRAVLLCRTEIWELWRDDGGDYIFVVPQVNPPNWLVVDPAFTNGEVFGDFSSGNEAILYPLQGLDNVLFVNRLASLGDLSLHASAVVMDGKGYAFIGPAGVGKSTLAVSLSANYRALVLGEDQIALRYLDERLWIFGTPWHENPAMCSPDGALLEKLFFLDRNASQGVKRLAPGEGITRILQTAFIPYYRPELVAGILDRLVLLSEHVPFYSLSYRLGTDPWELIRQA